MNRKILSILGAPGDGTCTALLSSLPSRSVPKLTNRMKIQLPIAVCLGLLLMPLMHAQTDSVPPDPEGIFAFRATSNEGHSGTALADQFILEAAEHARYPGGVFEPRFAKFSLSNIGPESCAVTEVFIYDPGHLIIYSSKFGTAGTFS